jgi:putative ABC transport system permease protein
VTFASFAARNVFRNRFRTVLTVLAVAFAVVCFLLLRTVIWAWTVAIDEGAQDRLATRHKVTFVMTLPERYTEQVRQVPGVEASTWANWFGAKDPRYADQFFASLAVDTSTYFDVYGDMVVPPAQLEAWKQDRQGAIVGRALADKFGYDIGDTVTLEGSIYPGNWEFHVSGIYETTSKAVDRSQFLFHWKYLNESVDAARRDQIGWIVSRADPKQGAQISQAIDAAFDHRDIQTLTMSERAMNLSFLGMFSAVLDAIDIVSGVILAIMMLILGNTIAMGVRERTHEYGVLRAIGFTPRHLAGFVLGEAAVVGLLGGGLGLALAYPIVEQGLGRFLEENMGSFFPYFRIPATAAAAAVGLAMTLALLASALPARRASKLRVVDALRKVA